MYFRCPSSAHYQVFMYKNRGLKMLEKDMKIPQHVAIIMDGNGRWAKRRGMPRTYGHAQGAKRVEEICRDADDLGIRYLTIYAFSTENWNRPQDEIDVLMKLFAQYIGICLKNALIHHMCVRVIGDKTGLNEDLQNRIRDMEDKTKDFEGLHLQIAINYGARDEMRRMIRKITADASEGRIKPDDITEQYISDHLDTGGIPDPDLLVRTCGEQRLSNYLLWQCAYTEFYVTQAAWPDFTKEELEKAIEAYNGRDRRFGTVNDNEK